TGLPIQQQPGVPGAPGAQNGGLGGAPQQGGGFGQPPHLRVVANTPPAQPAQSSPPPYKAAPSTAPGAPGSDEEPKDPGEMAAECDYEEDDIENSLSLAAIEAELKPKVMEQFDNIADSFKRLRRLQEQDIQLQLRSDSLSPAQERKYRKLKEEIIGEVKKLMLNQARIDSLVEQLYDINKKLVSNEGRLMRLPRTYRAGRGDSHHQDLPQTP